MRRYYVDYARYASQCQRNRPNQRRGARRKRQKLNTRSSQETDILEDMPALRSSSGKALGKSMKNTKEKYIEVIYQSYRDYSP